MKINTAINSHTETNNVVNTSHTFEIGDQGIVIDILRNRLYSNPIQTLVQEYISNARDANREAKQTRPIEITVPTNNDLTFKVRDYGLGLSPERVSEIFTKYGNSTKRNCNTQTGGFGIGAKSAWAYTDAFTVVSYYNGKAYHYIAHITKDKAGSLDLVTEKDTSELNGVEIQIPIQEKDLAAFDTASVRATKYWDRSEFPVFVNNKFRVREETIDRLGDFETVSWGVMPSESNNYYRPKYDSDLSLVIDGIPYPMPEEFKESKMVNELSRKLNCIGLFHFKTGVIEVSASREAVTNTPENKKLVENLGKLALKDINNMLVNKMMGCHSLREALDMHLELQKNYVHDHQSPYSLRFNNDLFKLDYDGTMQSSLLTNFTIEKFELGRRSYRSDSQRLSTNTMIVGKVDFRKGQWFYADDETSHAHQIRRVKPIVMNGMVYIIKGDINSPEFKKLVKHLNIQGTSSLGPVSTRKCARKTNNDDVLINIYPRPGSRETTSKIVNLGRNKTTYVYAIKDDKANNEWKQMNNILMASGVHFCLVSKVTSKQITGNANFIEFNNFLRAPSIPKNKELVEALKHYVIDKGKGYQYGYYPIELFKKLKTYNLKDLELVQALNTLSNIDRTSKLIDVNNEIVRINKCDHTDKLVKALSQTNEYLKQRSILDSKLKVYPLLKNFRNEDLDAQVLNDLELYLNHALDVKAGV